MHGRNRAEHKALSRHHEASAALGQKALQWNTLSHQLLLQYKRNKGCSNPCVPSLTQLSDANNGSNSPMDNLTMLALTDKLLRVNPDPSYLWNIRRHVLLLDHTPNSLPFDIHEELNLTYASLQRNPKAYGAWLHRKWSVRHFLLVEVPSSHEASNVHQTLLHKECDLCGQFLSMDERNFHCWNYRRFVVSALSFVIMKQHTHSTMFLQQATRDDCSDFYFVRNCADHPYSTKFAMDGSWKMFSDYMEYSQQEHLQLEHVSTDALHQESSVKEEESPVSTSSKPHIKGHSKQGSGGSLSYSSNCKKSAIASSKIIESWSIMGPQLAALNYTALDDSLCTSEEEIPPERERYGSNLLHAPRRELLQLLNTEWDFTTCKIQDNFSNCSAFHYRSKLLGLYLKYCYNTVEAQPKDESRGSSPTQQQSPIFVAVMEFLDQYESKLLPLAKEELNLVRQAIYTEPEDQTPWWYHRFILEWARPLSFDALMLQATTLKGSPRVRSLTMPKEEESKLQQVHQKCVSLYVESVLKQDQESLRELLTAEDGQLKWAWLALHKLFELQISLMDESEHEECLSGLKECVDNLIEIDPDRHGRYYAIARRNYGPPA